MRSLLRGRPVIIPGLRNGLLGFLGARAPRGLATRLIGGRLHPAREAALRAAGAGGQTEAG